MTLPEIKFKCERCGKCCKEYCSTFSATADDIIRWEMEGREDILAYTCFKEETWGDLFIHPITREEIYGKCPFLRKLPNKNIYKCLIQDTKPDVCREYPLDGICLRKENII